MLITNNIFNRREKLQINRRHDILEKRVSFKMHEDIFAKSRNGHLLKDTFDRENNTLDIHSGGLYPANVLSNLAHNEFVFDGIKCSSIEGFLQSLKINDRQQQAEICSLYGGSAKNCSAANNDWKLNNNLYWNGSVYDRNSDEYISLLKRAFLECYRQNRVYKTALDSTKGIKLTHRLGKKEKKDTILTADEFISILNYIRDDLS